MRIPTIFQKKEKSLSFENLFIVIASSIILVGWMVLTLMVAQMFFKLLIVTGMLLIAFFTLFYIRSYKSISKPTGTDLVAVAFVLLFSVFIAIFAHESFLSGRDEGEYSNWAYYVSQNGTYRLQDTQTPEVLVTAPVRPSITKPDFHFGYISWLGLHGVFGGIEGIKIGNFLPLIIGLLSLYFIGKRVGNKKVGIFTVLMLSTSFALIWYSRQTLTEVFSLALAWFSILCLLKAYTENENKYVIFSLSSLGLFLFTRAEGTWIFAMFFVMAPFLYIFRRKRWLLSKRTVCILLVIFSFFLYYSVFVQPRYFEVMPESVKSLIVTPVKRVTNLIQRSDKTVTKEQLSYVSNHPLLYIINVLASYNMFLPILLSIVVLLKALFSMKDPSSKFILLICFLIGPTFIYLFQLTTFHDHPWMLRRYVFTILPFACLLTAVFLERFTRKFKYVLLFLILAVNLIVSAPILTFAQFDGIVSDQIRPVAELLPDDAVVLCERNALGFRAPLRFIFEKNTVFTYANEVNSFINKAGSQPVYVVASSQKGGMVSFLPSGSLEHETEKTIRYKTLKNIGHIYEPSVFTTQHRIFQKTPKKIIDLAVLLQISKINENYKGFMPDSVVSPGEDWHFNEDGLELPRKTTAVFYLYFDDSKTLKMQLDNQPFKMCLEGKEECMLIKTEINSKGWLSIGFDEENVARKYERIKLVIQSGDENFLIRKMVVE